MRRARRVLVALLLALVATLALSGSASATDRPGILTPPCRVSDEAGCENSQEVVDDCKGAPTPDVPGRGVAGFFTHKPDQLPPDEDPFAKDARVSIYQVYGYAGLRFNTYDLGCGSDLVRNPDAVTGTAFGNWLLQLPKSMVAATGAVVGSALEPTFLRVFDPFVEKVVDALQVAIFERWMYLVVAALGFLLIWRARKAAMASSAGAIGWALLVMVLVTMVVRWPLTAGEVADQSAQAVLTEVSSGLTGSDPDQAGSAGESASSLMHESVLYRTWLAGTFGSSDSAAALKYGPQIFAATALTWREAAILDADPGKGRQIIERKKADFKEVAEQIKEDDPDAYDNLSGKRSDTRVGYAFVALVAALCVSPFLFVSALLVIGALIIIRIGVMFFPAIATLGLFPTLRGLVIGTGSTMAAALVNAMAFGIGASVLILGMGFILGSESVPGWLQLILMLLFTIVMWVALRPFRNLTRMVSGSSLKNSFADAVSAPGDQGRKALKTVGKVATAAAGVALGNVVTDRLGDNQSEERPQRMEAEPEITVTAQDLPQQTPAPVPARPRQLEASERRGLPGPPEPAPAPQGPGPMPPNRPAAAASPEPGPQYASGLDEFALHEPPVRRGRTVPVTPSAPVTSGEPLEGVVLPPARYELEDA